MNTENKGFLTTHVLDTAQGLPAYRLQIDLYTCPNAAAIHTEDMLINSVVTNADGRTDEPLLGKEDFKAGYYKLVFHAGDYLRTLGNNAYADNGFFLDQIPIMCHLADASQHYHVPLLLSPFGYSTYRGS